MDDLDKKLNDILSKGAKTYEGAGKVFFTFDDVARLIKQAFIDDGWARSGTPDAPHLYIDGVFKKRVNTMTGQEWYDRFEHEIEDEFVKVSNEFVEGEYLDAPNVMKAAKKAAGVDNES